MNSDILGTLFIFGFVVLLSFLIDHKKSSKYAYILLLVLLIGIVDGLFYSLTMAFPSIQIIKTYIWENNLIFNWSAKLYSIVFALLLLFPLRHVITLNDAGLSFKQNNNSLKFSLVVVLFFFVVASALGLLSNKSPFDFNPLLYTAIMPGLAEELIYRGILLGLLNKIFENKFKVWGTNFGWGAILTSIAFGLIHGFNVGDNYQIHFDFITVLLSAFYGFLYALLKERSGSLLFSVIGHGVVDFFNFFFRMV